MKTEGKPRDLRDGDWVQLLKYARPVPGVIGKLRRMYGKLEPFSVEWSEGGSDVVSAFGTCTGGDGESVRLSNNGRGR